MDPFLERLEYVAGAVLIVALIIYGKVAGIIRRRRERAAPKRPEGPRRRIPLT